MTDNIYAWAARHGCGPAALVELLDIIDPTRNVELIPSQETSEAAVQANIRLAAAKLGRSMWRNNNGAAVTDDGRHIRFGLGNDSAKINEVWKSSDLVGITPMVSRKAGEVFGVFTAVECKTPGWTMKNTQREIGQSNFASTVRALGGIAIFAQSTQDYTENLHHGYDPKS